MILPDEKLHDEVGRRILDAEVENADDVVGLDRRERARFPREALPGTR